MNALELALRQYKSVMPAPTCPWVKYPVRELEAWLREDVSKVAEKLAASEEFQGYATWSLTNLRPRASSPERKLLQGILSLLGETWQSLREVAPPAPRMPESSEESGGWRLNERIRITGLGEPAAIPGSQEASRHLPDRATTWKPQDWLTDGEIPEPFDADDYFEPQQFFFDQKVPTADMIPFLNPNLRVPGDFVVRTLFERLDILVDLEAKRLKNAPPGADPEAGDQLAEVRRRVGELRALCMTGARWERCDASVCLVQVHVAYHPQALFDWLPVSDRARSGAVGLRYRVKSQHNVATVDRIAAAIGSLEELFTRCLSDKNSITRRILEGGLVILAGRQEAYWEAKKFAISARRLWRLFLQLAKKAPLSQPVTVEDFDVDGPTTLTKDTLYAYICQLRTLLPPSLRERLKTLPDASYLLDLPRDRVFIHSGEGP